MPSIATHGGRIDRLTRTLRPMAMVAIGRPLPAELEEMIAGYIENFEGYYALHHTLGLGDASSFDEDRKAWGLP